MSPTELAKCRRVLAAVLAVAASAGLARDAHAHPHVWATVRSEIILDANRQITGVRHAWTFDEMYSAMAVQGPDANGDGVYSPEELKPPENASLDYDKSLLTLHFTLPLATPLNAHSQEVQVDVYDPSFFVAFGFATEAPVTLSGPAVKGCTAEVKKPDSDTEEDAKALSESFFSQLGPNSNFGSQFAQTVTVKCSDAPS